MSGQNDSSLSIQGQVRREFDVKGSRFIAVAAGVQGREDIEHLLVAVRKEFFDATHHCFAWRLGPDGSQFRTSDDGEPGGTAGRPILSAIDRRQLTDVIVIVTRYFGGTKLGVGGLSRAYAEAAGLAVAAAPVVTRWVTQELRFAFPHDQTGHVMRVVERFSGKIADVRYEEEVFMHLLVRRSWVEDVLNELKNRTAGNLRLL